jgi:hypothetical protein
MTNRTLKFKNISEQIIELVDEWHKKLIDIYDETLSNLKKPQDRIIKEIIGHLVDSASNNHQRIVRLQYNSVLEFPDYRQHNEKWILMQNYQETNWEDLLNLWKFYNYHLVHVFRNINKNALKHTWKDFEGNIISLEELVTSYLFHVNLHLGEIEELID